MNHLNKKNTCYSLDEVNSIFNDINSELIVRNQNELAKNLKFFSKPLARVKHIFPLKHSNENKIVQEENKDS